MLSMVIQSFCAQIASLLPIPAISSAFLQICSVVVMLLQQFNL